MPTECGSARLPRCDYEHTATRLLAKRVEPPRRERLARESARLPRRGLETRERLLDAALPLLRIRRGSGAAALDARQIDEEPRARTTARRTGAQAAR